MLLGGLQASVTGGLRATVAGGLQTTVAGGMLEFRESIPSSHKDAFKVYRTGGGMLSLVTIDFFANLRQLRGILGL
jgi:hypothetical protein